MASDGSDREKIQFPGVQLPTLLCWVPLFVVEEDASFPNMFTFFTKKPKSL